MDTVKWTELATIAVAVIAALVAAVSPFVSWRLARRGQIDDARRQVKLSVFGGVMQNRHSAESYEVIKALNLVDVAFHDDAAVRRLWREYLEMINSRAFFENNLGGPDAGAEAAGLAHRDGEKSRFRC
jgi:hypothetical protein